MSKKYLKVSVSSARLKGPSKSNYIVKREPLEVSANQLNDMNGFITNGVFRLRPDDDNNRLLLQVNWYLANHNEFQARHILRSLGLTAKKIKNYIEEEKSLQRRRPEESGFIELHNNPMPEEYRVRGN
jgi:hypothetical protein|tara:strand:+ start:217 stop:600 length:384 start_codon:yes stop_codon:yes gene_type:complete